MKKLEECLKLIRVLKKLYNMKLPIIIDALGINILSFNLNDYCYLH